MLLCARHEPQVIEGAIERQTGRTLRIDEHGVALSRKTVVELHHGAADGRPPLPQRHQRLAHLGLAVQILEPFRAGYPRLSEDPPTPRLGSQGRQGRIHPAQRNPEQHGQFAL
jgi:hypothetical protein